MDPAPRAFVELPRDAELGVRVPFACGTDDGYGGSGPSVRRLDGRRVTQCALSRVCGVCGAGLGRPIAFLGTRREVDRNAFHFPGSHLACAEALLAEVDGVEQGSAAGLLGQEPTPDSWVLVTTAGFEFVRPGRDDLDRRPTFQPNSLLG